MKALFTLIVVLVAGLPGLALAEVNCSRAELLPPPIAALLSMKRLVL